MSLDQYFELTETPHTIVVRPKCHGGAFAEEASRAIWPELLEHCKENGADVVFDFGSLSFFGSTMLDLVATVNKQARRLENRVVLANLTPTGREVIEIARFDQFITIYPTVEEATSALS